MADPRRNLLALISIGLLLGAAAMFFIWPPPPESAVRQESYAACLRMGIALGLWWLAWPQTIRLPMWIWAGIPTAVVVVALRPKLVIWAIPIVMLIAVLRPRRKKS